MTARSAPRRPRPPLDQKQLEELALRYVGKYATSLAKLSSYLARKVRERGWAGDEAPDFAGLAARFSEIGYVDDRAYALSKAQSLTSRGFGKRRVEDKLRLDGIGEDEGADARLHAEREALAAALRFAQRRRIGPFAADAADRHQREKAIAAMVRAGHSFSLARAIAGLRPGAEVDEDDLRERAGVTEA